MKAFVPSQVSRVTSKLLPFLFTSIVSVVFISGCSGGMLMQTPPMPTGNTQVVVLMTSTANDQLTVFYVSLAKITLTNGAGTQVTVYSNPSALTNPTAGVGVEWMHLNGAAEPLTSVSLPQGTYTSASVQVAGCSFTDVTFDPTTTGLTRSTYAQGLCGQGTGNTTVNLASPIAISGSAMALALHLQVPQSFTLNGTGASATYTISPVFTLTPFVIASQPTNIQNGKLAGVNGQVTAVNTQANNFTVQTPAGNTLTLSSNGNTAYQGVAGFGTLAAGVLVNWDAAIQPDGSLRATRVEVDDLSAPAVLIGPTFLGADSQTNQFQAVLLQQQGCTITGNPFCGNLFQFQSTTAFAISGEFSNVQQLPFAANFSGSSLFEGQNVSAYTAGAFGTQSFEIVTAVTLVPQTINGTVTAVTQENGFTVYTVTLAAYDLFPVLQMYGGPYPRITQPASVTVYTDTNTQMLSQGLINPGSLLRFRGLIFDDNGTMRMDCGQIYDGVAE
jgi:hypothetical protein